MSNETLIQYDMELKVDREYIAKPDSTYEFTLEPTDVVIVDGERYLMVDRKADVGEKVIVTNKGDGWYDDKIGCVYEVIDGDKYGFSAEDFDEGENAVYVEQEQNDYGCIAFISDVNYNVLEPLENDEQSTETTLTANDVRWHPEKVIDMFAALSQKVVTLERKLDDLADTTERALKIAAGHVDDNTKNIETLARDTEEVRAVMLRNESDIADLDDRTQPLTGSSDTLVLPMWFFERLVGGDRK
jgi:hypothetical protein